MSNKVINARIKNKRDTDSNWQSKNPVLLNGEIILVDMNDGELRAKIGDGKNSYNQLSFSDEILRSLINDTEDKVSALQGLVGDAAVSDQIESAISEHTHPVDSALSSTSVNPVQNKVVFNAVQALIDGLGNEPVADQISTAVGDCVTDLSISNNVITYTKANSETDTITIQDTKVNREPINTNGDYPILLSRSSVDSTVDTTAVINNKISANPYEGSIYVKRLEVYGTAKADGAYAGGLGSFAHNIYSFAHGQNVTASNTAAFAHGNSTEATGYASTAEGDDTVASGTAAHAEGTETTASGFYSHAQGYQTTASGNESHAEGNNTTADGECSHAEGYHTIANGNYSHVQGKYNVLDSRNKYAHIIGNGTADDSRANIHTVGWDGNAWFSGDVYVGGTDKSSGEKLVKQSELPAETIIDTTLAISGQAADAKITGDAIGDLKTLVGDTSVSTQISNAMSGIAGSADKLNTDAGSSTNPVYFSDGVPVACTYSLNKTVPSDAKFTDTDTKVTQTSISSTDMSSAGHYPILLAYSDSPVSGTSSTANYNSKFTANPYTGQIKTLFLQGDEVSVKRITIGTDDGYGKLYFVTAEDSKIIGNTPSGADCEMMRIGGDATTPLLIIGDGLYTNKIGKTNISAGKAVQIITPNERVVLEDIGSTDYTGYFRPNTKGKCALGTAANTWKQLFAATTTISTSDEREKNNIMSIADYPSMFSNGNIFEILFSKLMPKTFYLNSEENSPELHIGFIAQDVVAVLEEIGMTEDDIAFVHHGFWIDEETGEEKDVYGLRYEEFIALNTYMIQKLMTERDEMKSRLEKIEAMLGIS